MKGHNMISIIMRLQILCLQLLMDIRKDQTQKEYTFTKENETIQTAYKILK
jgi:hypothetical protein